MATKKSKVSVPVQDDQDESNSIDIDEVKASQDDEVKNPAQMNGFKLGLTRNLIKLKNHIAYVPLILTCVSMIILTCSLRDHNEAAYYTISDSISFWMFCDILASILSCLCFLNVSNIHSSKKKVIAFSAFFYALLIVEIFIEYYMLHDYKVEMNLANSPISKDISVYTLNESAKWLKIHLGFVFATIATAIAAPILQPYFSKIKIKK